MTGVSFLLSIIISLPLILVTRLERLFQDTSFCHEVWPSLVIEQVHVGFTISVQFLLPSVTVMVIYTSIYTKFSRSRASLARNVRVSPGSQRRRLRTNIMLCSFSLMFLLSWAPINILTLLNKIFGFTLVCIKSQMRTQSLMIFLQTESTWFVIFGICHIIGMSSSCTTPVLYAFVNKNFSLFRCPSCRTSLDMDQNQELLSPITTIPLTRTFRSTSVILFNSDTNVIVTQT